MNLSIIKSPQDILTIFSLCETRSLTNFLDSNKLKIGDARSLLAILHEFKEPSWKFPSDLGLLDHIHISFLYQANNYKDALCFFTEYGSKFTITPAKGWVMMFVTASLFDIYNAIKLSHQNLEIRQMLNQLQTEVEEFGFHDLFKKFSRKTLQDGTFILC